MVLDATLEPLVVINERVELEVVALTLPDVDIGILDPEEDVSDPVGNADPDEFPPQDIGPTRQSFASTAKMEVSSVTRPEVTSDFGLDIISMISASVAVTIPLLLVDVDEVNDDDDLVDVDESTVVVFVEFSSAVEDCLSLSSPSSSSPPSSSPPLLSPPLLSPPLLPPSLLPPPFWAFCACWFTLS